MTLQLSTKALTKLLFLERTIEDVKNTTHELSDEEIVKIVIEILDRANS